MAQEDTPFYQLPDIFRALEYLKIPYQETKDCEADDWIASYALGVGEGCEITIVSQDSDFFQLITHRVRVLRYRGKQSLLCDQAYIQEKLGITPQRYALFKSLTGDNADHIPGVAHVGPKTAADLVNRFGDLETLLSNTALIPKPSIRRSVEQNAARIRLNATLITLKGGHALPFALDEFEFSDMGLTTMEVLSAIGLR
jgi:DNA polymerase-1